MPVHLDSHEPDVDLTPGTAKSDIVAFLYSHPELGFKPNEIEDYLELPHGTVTTTLKRLSDQGFVGKTADSHYHALEHREDLHRYVSSLDQVQRLFDADEFEETTEWNENPEAVDEDELDAEINELEADFEDA
ncbi:MarR family transcriptional regulator [Halosimplex halobium]|uniref:MarR family transcriptional regulator n=1 Tax=Halosimplex halobium TaxID=3396618 RepID=UPI003F575A9E